MKHVDARHADKPPSIYTIVQHTFTHVKKNKEKYFNGEKEKERE